MTPFQPASDPEWALHLIALLKAMNEELANYANTHWL